MKKPVSINKVALMIGVLSGLVTTLIITGLDWYRGKPFSIYKFVLFFLVIGGLNMLAQRYSLKKKEAKKESL